MEFRCSLQAYWRVQVERIKISKKFLIKEYIINKKSTTQIAKMLKCSHRCILNRLKQYNIKTRTIRGSIKLLDRSGKNNSRYIDGRSNESHYCIDCNRRLSDYRAKRCKPCADKQHSLKISGKNNPFFGKHHTKRVKNIIAKTNKERKHKLHTKESRNKMSLAHKGKKFSKETLKRMVIAGKKKIFTEQHRANMSLSKGGTGIPHEKFNLKNTIRCLQEYNNWRKCVYKRDNYTCQECNIRSGNGKAVYLEAHHLKPFAKLLSDFLAEYNQFSPIEDKETLVRLAIKWQPFWELDNGKTLCGDCHNLTRNGRPIKKEEGK